MRNILIPNINIILVLAAFGSGGWNVPPSPQNSKLPAQARNAEEGQKPALMCPDKIEVTEQAGVPSTPVAGEHMEWNAPPVKAAHPLEGITIFNGEMGDTQPSLAPDDEVHRGKHYKQTWHVKDYRDRNVWLQCRYQDTRATLAVNIPVQIQNCEFTFDMDAKGNITQPVLECR
jgi:hypothetical protein